jgi:hypothetical protein
VTVEVAAVTVAGAVVVETWGEMAAMVAAVVWGLQQHDRAAAAELASEHLGQQLESERRLAAQPAPASGAGTTYKVVTYTPERGTF